MRIIITSQQEIPQVEVAMPARAGMHIDVDQLRPVMRMRHRKPEFLVRLAYRRYSRIFTVVDVPARLQPQTQSLVDVQHHATATDDDCRRRHMTNIGVLTERYRQLRHDVEKLGD